ncbi:multidrug resistance-associated ABC transporter [Flagelloscypha sp. PMI_526]|nr:multidrug resistance-associated ABC transporter [Flagelloscypha sp. PMI_526]
MPRWLHPKPAPPDFGKGTVCPERNSNVLVRPIYSWLDSMLWAGFTRPLLHDDLWELPSDHRAEYQAQALEEAFFSRVPEAQRPAHLSHVKPYPKQDSSLIRAIHRTWMGRFWFAAFLKLIADTLISTTPLVNKVLLEWLSLSYLYFQTGPEYAAQYGIEKPRGIGFGIGIALAVFGMRQISVLCDQYYMQETMRLGMFQRTALIANLHRKALRLSPKSRLTHSVGKIITMIAKDSDTFDTFTKEAPLLIVAPVQIIIGLGLLIWTLGYSALAGFGIIVAVSPIFLGLITLLFKARKKGEEWSDKRVRLSNEIFQSIRLIKFFSWTSYFEQKIFRLRLHELSAARTFGVAIAGAMSILMFLPVGATILAFVTYALTGHNLDIPTIFTAFQFFLVLQGPLAMFPIVMSTWAHIKVSLDRIEEFLLAEEMPKPYEVVDDLDVGVEVDGCFEWDVKVPEEQAEKANSKPKDTPGNAKAEKRQKNKKEIEKKLPSALNEKEGETEETPFSLSDLKLSVPRGAFHAIVGSIGSGKSSILEALVGEMRKTQGWVRFGGDIAYVPQTAWIRNQTLRDNILFGQPYDEMKYREVIQACCLEPDLDILPDGDMTEIGERGINLSGGQRARLSLARAAYSPYPVVLLDDPLSAVDAHVSQSLMSHCFLSGPLSKRTRLLVTHALHVLPTTDYVYMVEKGKIVAQGAYQDLIESNAEFARLVSEYGGLRKEHDLTVQKIVSESGQKENQEAADVLMQAEERVTGSVGWGVYVQFFRLGGGMAWAPVLIVLLTLQQVFSSLVLVWWTSGQFGLTQNQYIGMYAGIGASMALLTYFTTFAFLILTIIAGKHIFQRAFHALMNAPVSYYDTTPIGRILSRLSRDQDTIDGEIAWLTRTQFFQAFTTLFGIVALVAYTFPLLTTIFVPLLCLYLLVSVFYRATSVETKRLESILRSALYAEVTESATGLSTLRAYKLQRDSIRSADDGQDRQNQAYFITISIQRWLSVRLETFGSILVLGIGLFAAGYRSTVNPAKIGNVLAYTLQITQALSETIVHMAQMEQAFNSVERLLHFTNITPEGKEDAKEPPSPSWPERGSVEFDNVKLAYRPTLPLVLHGVSFSVKPGEKFAICGRTGSGKSSLLQALLRMVEVQEGRINIDDIDVGTLDLVSLRSRIAIVPQESPLFQGTIRQNIDPQCFLTDGELISILQRTGLLPPSGVSDPAAEVKFGLDSSVEDQGTNYSAGEKQLIALCRALAKNSRIIILDEATSSVDSDTDAKIQQTIRREFADRTLLCIAHRIGTILSYDRVLVMDKGTVGELGPILELFDKEDSMFRGLCNDASLTREDIMKLKQ